MRFIADLHIHSHFSRATSRNLDPEHLSLWAQKKGIRVIGTGDLTHPGWIAELQEKLVDAGNGLYRLKPELEKMIRAEIPESCHGPTGFMLSGEISCIYKRDGKTRKAHHLILMPDFESAVRLNKSLDRIGNITSDGRPILGLDSRDLLETVMGASDRAFFIPAHIWTPWFSLFGSKSGFDSIEECFGDLTPHIHALETGLSSDPPMNRLLSALDDYLLVSNSDAHSPPKLGREANIFDTELDYDQIISAMINKEGFEGTIEFYPEEGKYHLDGHRKCQVRLHPAETNECQGICPSCGKPLTVGVLHRVAELADRDRPKMSKDFFSLIPLPEILSEILDCGPATKKVNAAYEGLIATLGPELPLLMDLPIKDIDAAGGILLAKGIDRMRRNQVIRQEGYDGEFGIIRLFRESEKAELAGQGLLFKRPKTKKTRKKKTLPAKGSLKTSSQKHSGQGQAAFSDPILDPLNTAQKEAVTDAGSHLLIVAGPGTGKTMTLTHRIAHIIRSGLATPEQILALTFTNKAAREMRKRIHALIPERQSGKVRTATFHGFCLKVLRAEAERLNLPSDFVLCSGTDVSVLARRVVSESGKGKRPASDLLKYLQRLKMNTVTGDDKPLSDHELLPLFRKYQERLRDFGMLDLDDLEVETLRLLQDHPEVCLRYSERFPKIFVDEYQDTNRVQAALLKTLINKGRSEICAIGDPDQAIYGFRGADVRNFHRFSEDFPGAREIVLSKNYRSTQTILNGSSDLMGKEEPLEGTKGKGDSIRLSACRTQSEEAEMVVEHIERLLGGTSHFSIDSGRVASHEDGEEIGFGDIAVLFRLNAQGDAFVEAFLRAGIPFIRSGERPLISQYPVNIIWRLLQVLHYPDTRYYLDTYLDLLDKKGRQGREILKGCEIGRNPANLIEQALSLHEFDLSSEESTEALRRLKELADNFDGDMESFLDMLSLDRGIDHLVLSGDRVALMSLHAAKGLEWPVVFITGCEDRLIPCSLFNDRDESEEKRLLYVGMTRARQRLILSHARRRMINGRRLDMNPSPFITHISENLCGPLERSEWKRKRKSHKQMKLFKT
ncbi:MAG: UvrD-helicase domain-containing protein [Deltaproteobacteria bacterium]|nr:UvrD-helicase domain-containing protein [Deltaproteobacteria bacterium]